MFKIFINFKTSFSFIIIIKFFSFMNSFIIKRLIFNLKIFTKIFR